MTALRIVFAGSPAAAVPSLRTLIDGPHDVVAVVTREDSSQGRKRIMTPTPVALEAEAAGRRVIRANRLTEVTDDLIELRADLGVIVAYGGLVQEPLLSAPRLGWINLHFSLLPRWRGAAPVQHAIMAGDRETGAVVFQLTAALDAGDILASQRTTIDQHETAGQVLNDLATSGALLLAGAVDDLAGGKAKFVPQEGDVTLAPKLTLEDGRIDWSLDANQLHARVRGTNPEPGAFAMVDGDRIKILETALLPDAASIEPGVIEERDGIIAVGTSTFPLELRHVHPAGKRAMPAAAWWRGRSRDAE